jgi:hypothetical protein
VWVGGACGRAVRLVLFLGDRYLCIDMGDGGVALGWCWLRLVANSNAEACCIFTFLNVVWARVHCAGEDADGEGATLFALLLLLTGSSCCFLLPSLLFDNLSPTLVTASKKKKSKKYSGL